MQKAEPIRSGHFHFDPQDPIYADHFPGRAVVPGSLIIEAFMTAARGAMQGPGACSIENFRFKHFIAPGRYAYRLESRTDGRLQCTLLDQGRTVATGTLRGLL